MATVISKRPTIARRSLPQAKTARRVLRSPPSTLGWPATRLAVLGADPPRCETTSEKDEAFIFDAEGTGCALRLRQARGCSRRDSDGFWGLCSWSGCRAWGLRAL